MSDCSPVVDVMGYVGPINNWKALGVAIVCQAIYDWKDVVSQISKHGDATKVMLKKKNEAEHFFDL